MDFTKVITQPLGLAGFALALVFGISGIFAHKGKSTPKWLPAVAVTLAGVCLAGGLLLSYASLKPTPSPSPTAPAQQVAGGNAAATQGGCAPALAGVAVGGSMSINCDKSADQRPTTPAK